MTANDPRLTEEELLLLADPSKGGELAEFLRRARTMKIEELLEEEKEKRCQRQRAQKELRYSRSYMQS